MRDNLLALSLLLSVLTGCQRPAETPVQALHLPAPWDRADMEYSGLSWCNDSLVLLPQFPDTEVISYPRSIVRTAVSHGSLPAPDIWPLNDGGSAEMAGFDGYEALICDADRAWFLAEFHANEQETHSYLIPAQLNHGFQLFPEQAIVLRSPRPRPNLGNEALLIHGQRLYSFYEHNSAEHLNPEAVRLDLDTGKLTRMPMTDLPFRLTDVSASDSEGRFWAINYFYPGDTDMQRHHDPIKSGFGQGRTQAQHPWTERLIEFQIRDQGIELSGREPIQLQLSDSGGRNWEGLARLDDLGFLIISDQHPDSLFGFIPYEDN